MSLEHNKQATVLFSDADMHWLELSWLYSTVATY